MADDNPNNLRLLGEVLRDVDSEVRVAIDGVTALASVEESPPSIILLDVHMPRMDGYAVCETLKNDHRFKDIPVIFLSGLDEAFNKLQAFKLGAIDYITKPFDPDEVKLRVQTHLRHTEVKNELARCNLAVLEREHRIIDLKNEVNVLTRELGRVPPYRNHNFELGREETHPGLSITE